MSVRKVLKANYVINLQAFLEKKFLEELRNKGIDLDKKCHRKINIVLFLKSSQEKELYNGNLFFLCIHVHLHICVVGFFYVNDRFNNETQAF